MTEATRRQLILVRHAKSTWTTDVPDPERPLGSRGRRDAKAIGTWLVDHHLEPDLVYCSTARRARETFDHAVRGGVCFGHLLHRAELYSDEVADQLAVVHAIDSQAKTVLMVGHHPALADMARLIAPLTSDPSRLELEERFPTSVIVVLDIDVPWSEVGAGTGQVAAFAVPRG